MHQRKLKKDPPLDGALRGCLSAVNGALAPIESGPRLEKRRA